MEQTILVSGAFGVGDAEADARLHAALGDLARRPGLRVVVTSGDPVGTGGELKVDAIPAGSIPALVAQAQRCDLLLVDGGDLGASEGPGGRDSLLTSRHEGVWRTLGALAVASMLRRPSLLYAGIASPPPGRDVSRPIRLAAGLSSRLLLRDPGSVDALRAAGVDGATLARAEVAADPAWGLEPAPDDVVDAALSDIGPGPGADLLGVALAGSDVDTPAEEIARALDARLAEDEPVRVLLLPWPTGTGSQNSAVVVERLLASLHRRDRVACAPTNLTPALRAGLVGRCRQLLVTSSHGALLALKAGVPVVALGDDPHLTATMDAVGGGRFVLPSSESHADEIGRRLRHAERALDPTSPDDRARLDALVARARRLGDVALELAAGTVPRFSETKHFLAAVCLDRIVQSASSEEAAVGRDARFSDLQRQLAELEESTAGRLVHSVWRVVNHVLPEGSRRRRAYERLRGREPLPVPEGPGRTAPSSHPPAGRDAVESFLVGEVRRFEERAAATASRRLALVFSAGTPFDVDQGQRSTQIALELARRDIPVVYCYWRWSAADDALRNHHDLVLQLPHHRLEEWLEPVAGLLPDRRRVALFEWPHHRLHEALVRLRGRGWTTVYDVVDDWDAFAERGIGQLIDNQAHETLFVTTCDLVVAVAPALAERARSLGRPRVPVVANGVDLRIAEIDAPLQVARGEVTAGYFGCLASAWFDWDAIIELARRRPGWQLHVIGYGNDATHLRLPGNILLHGSQPQHRLAAHAAGWDVGLVPFREGAIAGGSEPIKIYEYLAMGLPVVTTGVPVPPGTEGFVRRASSVDGILTAVEDAARRRESLAGGCRDLAASCTWSHRVDRLLELVDEVDGER